MFYSIYVDYSASRPNTESISSRRSLRDSRYCNLSSRVMGRDTFFCSLTTTSNSIYPFAPLSSLNNFCKSLFCCIISVNNSWDCTSMRTV